MGRRAAFFPIVFALGAIILAGGAIAREEGPTEIEKRRTIDKPGSYKLVNNLTGPLSGPGDCLEIAADFVTIGLAGFTISGPGGGAGIAALTSGQGLAVRTGSISGFTIGIDLKLADGSIVEGLRVVGTSFSNVDGTIASGIVKGNTVISYQTGIIATGTVTGNYALSNSSIGFLIGTGSTVIGNTATGGRGGFLVSCPSNVTDNTAINNTVDNITLENTGCNNTNNVAP
jgi:hypothetical protein